MIFRIPDEFSYPAIQYLDNCWMLGRSIEYISSTDCKLDRIDGHTYVTIITSAYYSHEIKIIRIGHTNYSYLFGAP